MSNYTSQRPSRQVPLPAATRTRVLVDSAPPPPGSALPSKFPLPGKERALARRAEPSTMRRTSEAPPSGSTQLGNDTFSPTGGSFGRARRAGRLRRRPCLSRVGRQPAAARVAGCVAPRGRVGDGRPARAVAAACAVAVAVALAHVSAQRVSRASGRRLAFVLLIIGILCAAMRVWASVMPTYGGGAQGVRMRTEHVSFRKQQHQSLDTSLWGFKIHQLIYDTMPSTSSLSSCTSFCAMSCVDGETSLAE